MLAKSQWSINGLQQSLTIRDPETGWPCAQFAESSTPGTPYQGRPCDVHDSFSIMMILLFDPVFGRTGRLSCGITPCPTPSCPSTWAKVCYIMFSNSPLFPFWCYLHAFCAPRRTVKLWDHALPHPVMSLILHNAVNDLRFMNYLCCCLTLSWPLVLLQDGQALGSRLAPPRHVF